MIRDWSTGTEDGAEHDVTLHVWSRTGGKKEMQEIIEAVRIALHDKPLVLADHRLVNLRHAFSEARLDPDGDTFHGVVRYRAVTEPAQAAAAWCLSVVARLRASPKSPHVAPLNRRTWRQLIPRHSQGETTSNLAFYRRLRQGLPHADPGG